MAEKTMGEIKKIEEEISIALQVLRNEIETLAIIREHSVLNNLIPSHRNTIIQDEISESVGNIDELIKLHKSLVEKIDKLEYLVQDLISTKS